MSKNYQSSEKSIRQGSSDASTKDTSASASEGVNSTGSAGINSSNSSTVVNSFLQNMVTMLRMDKVDYKTRIGSSSVGIRAGRSMYETLEPADDISVSEPKCTRPFPSSLPNISPFVKSKSCLDADEVREQSLSSSIGPIGCGLDNSKSLAECYPEVKSNSLDSHTQSESTSKVMDIVYNKTSSSDYVQCQSTMNPALSSVDPSQSSKLLDEVEPMVATTNSLQKDNMEHVVQKEGVAVNTTSGTDDMDLVVLREGMPGMENMDLSVLREGLSVNVNSGTYDMDPAVLREGLSANVNSGKEDMDLAVLKEGLSSNDNTNTDSQSIEDMDPTLLMSANGNSQFISDTDGVDPVNDKDHSHSISGANDMDPAVLKEGLSAITISGTDGVDPAVLVEGVVANANPGTDGMDPAVLRESVAVNDTDGMDPVKDESSNDRSQSTSDTDSTDLTALKVKPLKDYKKSNSGRSDHVMSKMKPSVSKWTPETSNKPAKKCIQRKMITRSQKIKMDVAGSPGSSFTPDCSETNIGSDDSECTVSAYSDNGEVSVTGRVTRSSRRNNARNLPLRKMKFKCDNHANHQAKKVRAPHAKRLETENKQVRHLKRMNRCRGRAVQRRLSTLDSSQTSGSSGTETEPEVRGKRKIRKCRGYQHDTPQHIHSCDDEYLPPSKRKKHQVSNPEPAPSTLPIKGNILANILTDIPEVDIAPLSVASSAHSHNQHSINSRLSESNINYQIDPVQDKSQKLSQIKGKKSISRPDSSSKSKSHVGIKSDSGSKLVQSREDGGSSEEVSDSEETVHFKVLKSWESDYLRGCYATRGPMLYAMEKFPEKLNYEGPWMVKAKYIWSVWRHRIPEPERRLYTERAKKNRLLLFGSKRGNVMDSPIRTRKFKKMSACKEALSRKKEPTNSKMPTQLSRSVAGDGPNCRSEQETSASYIGQETPSYSMSDLNFFNGRAKSKSLPPVLNRQLMRKALGDLPRSVIDTSSEVTSRFHSRSLSPTQTVPVNSSLTHEEKNEQVEMKTAFNNMSSVTQRNEDDPMPESPLIVQATVNTQKSVSRKGLVKVQPTTRSLKKFIQGSSKNHNTNLLAKANWDNSVSFTGKSTSGSVRKSPVKLQNGNKRSHIENPTHRSALEEHVTTEDSVEQSVQTAVNPWYYSQLNSVHTSQTPMKTTPPFFFHNSTANNESLMLKTCNVTTAGTMSSADFSVPIEVVQNRSFATQLQNPIRKPNYEPFEASPQVSNTGKFLNTTTGFSKDCSSNDYFSKDPLSKYHCQESKAKKCSQGLSSLLSSHMPANIKSFVIPQMSEVSVHSVINPSLVTQKLPVNATDQSLVYQQPDMNRAGVNRLSSEHSTGVISPSTMNEHLHFMKNNKSTPTSVQSNHGSSNVSSTVCTPVSHSCMSSSPHSGVTSPFMGNSRSKSRSRSSSTSSSALSSPSPSPRNIKHTERATSTSETSHRRGTVHHTCSSLGTSTARSLYKGTIPIFRPKSSLGVDSSIQQSSGASSGEMYHPKQFPVVNDGIHSYKQSSGSNIGDINLTNREASNGRKLVSPSIVTVTSLASSFPVPNSSCLNEAGNSPSFVHTTQSMATTVTKRNIASNSNSLKVGRHALLKGSNCKGKRSSRTSSNSELSLLSLPALSTSKSIPLKANPPHLCIKGTEEISLSHRNLKNSTELQPSTSSNSNDHRYIQPDELNHIRPSELSTSQTLNVIRPKESNSSSLFSTQSSSTTTFSSTGPMTKINYSVGVPLADLSKMTKWEVEQLYYYNAALLEQQKHLTKLLETQLVMMEKEESHQNSYLNLSRWEMYDKHLAFTVEPEVVPDFSTSKLGFCDSKAAEIKDLIVGGTAQRPMINNKYDVYAKFSKFAYR